MTLSLDKSLLRKTKVLAARLDTSISGLLSQQPEALVGEDEAYERARHDASRLLEKGFHLGGAGTVSRDEWHERLGPLSTRMFSSTLTDAGVKRTIASRLLGQL